MDPTFAGFLAFVSNVMAIPPSALPTASPYPAMAFNTAQNLVNVALQGLTNFDPSQPTLYAVAVYNLAGDILVNIAPDQPGSTYFANLWAGYGGNGFTAGVVSSTSDEGTSASFAVSQALQNLTLGDLQLLKTPWGRAYLAIAQSYGPSVWGLS